jgi:hypothetical protein
VNHIKNNYLTLNPKKEEIKRNQTKMDFENNKPLFHKILFMELAPWSEMNKPIEKFADKISGLKTIELDFSPRYKIDFPYRPFNVKTNFYSKLILNESITYCNEVFHLLKNESDLRVKKYWRNDILEKKLPGWLIESGKILKEKQYSIDYINPQKYSFDIDPDHKTETYIMQLLKVALIWTYLEIQSFFTYLTQDELLLEEDLYIRYLFEPVPNESFLVPNTPVITIKPIEKLPDTVEFEEEISLDSFRYIHYEKSPDKLADFCDSLKKHKFISKENTLPNFKKAFSGDAISTPVIWSGNPSEFSYLIKLLHNQYGLVKNLKQRQWEVACECFVPASGPKFNRSVRKLQIPASADKLIKAVKLLI